MPAAYARTTSYAVSNAALPYLLATGEHGTPAAFAREPALRRGLTLDQGRLVHRGVAAALGRDAAPGPTDTATETAEAGQ
jgi:alanine dehydrogenase